MWEEFIRLISWQFMNTNRMRKSVSFLKPCIWGIYRHHLRCIFFCLFVVVQCFAVQTRIWNSLLWVVKLLLEMAHERYILMINTSSDMLKWNIIIGICNIRIVLATLKLSLQWLYCKYFCVLIQSLLNKAFLENGVEAKWCCRFS